MTAQLSSMVMVAHTAGKGMGRHRQVNQVLHSEHRTHPGHLTAETVPTVVPSQLGTPGATNSSLSLAMQLERKGAAMEACSEEAGLHAKISVARHSSSQLCAVPARLTGRRARSPTPHQGRLGCCVTLAN